MQTGLMATRQGLLLVAFNKREHGKCGGGGDKMWPLASRKMDRRDRSWPEKCESLAVIVATTKVGVGLKWKILVSKINLGGRPRWRRLANNEKWPESQQWRWSTTEKVSSPAANTMVSELWMVSINNRMQGSHDHTSSLATTQSGGCARGRRL